MNVDRMSARFVSSFAFRLINAFSTLTFFQPDEYYQAWEPAFADVHGSGFRAWEWQAGIRTSSMPRLFAAVIHLASYLGISHLVLGKILMAFVAAIADVATGSLAGKIGPRETSSKRQRIAWLLSSFSMFNWYCSTRPFSNTFEMVLVVCALNLWQPNNILVLALAQALAHLAIALRPSDGFFWLSLGLNLLWSTRALAKCLKILVVSILTGIVTQCAVLWLDQKYYQGLRGTPGTFPFIEFMKQNFGSRVSEIYGVLPWHWYISQGIPFSLLGYLPFAMVGWWYAPRNWKLSSAANVFAFSCIAHKEFRFIYFSSPIFHVIVALSYEYPIGKMRWLSYLAIAVNVIVALYFSSFHQRGVVDVVQFISRSPDIKDVSFLMPCHSTPWQAHFGRFDTTFTPQFLTCDPPWNRTSEGYVDEADRFYANPAKFLSEHPDKSTKTVVAFEQLQPTLKDYGYLERYSFYNGLFSDDWRRYGRVIVFEREREPEML